MISSSKQEKAIFVKGVREHNLAGFDLILPRHRLIVITGVSGSGKSSLAFDTLYAEGHRKYMESLSPRARQVLRQLPRPDVDYIEGLSPVVAIGQRTGGENPRSTIASVTEIADYARLLWAVRGEPFCPLDGGRVRRRTLDDCLDSLMEWPEGTRAMLLAPVMRARPAVVREELARLRQKGFQRVRLNEELAELSGAPRMELKGSEIDLEIVVDRVVLKAEQRARLADSLEMAFVEGGNRAIALVEQKGEGGASSWKKLLLSQEFACEICGTVYPAPTPRLFNWNHPDGACPECGGLGETRRFQEELLVPDRSKSVRGGAIKPFRLGSKRTIIRHNALLKQLASQLPFDPTQPWQELPEELRMAILRGTEERLFSFKLKPGNRKPDVVPWKGVIGELEDLFRETSSDGLRARLSTFQSSATCPSCQGGRLNPYARAVKLAGLGFDAFMRLPVREARTFLEDQLMARKDLEVVGEALQGLQSRLRFLSEVGLDYLTLDRPYVSLSSGESQRVRLATQVGMGLVGVIYVLDEPSTGLHPCDHRRLIELLKKLRDQGNTVIVVEHDGDTMRAADHLIELGPGAGPEGGRLVFEGTPEDCQVSNRSVSADYLSGRKKVGADLPEANPGKRYIEVLGASEHNLREVTARFPVGCLSVVCGVSGSGKSTLINDVLGKALALRMQGAKVVPGSHRGLSGEDLVDQMVRIDQTPIGRSPRSNPATFTKVFDLLRSVFASTPLAKVRGYGPGRFSFNIPGGRCEKCKGDGVIRLDMQFLSDAFVECPSCGGRRYNRETLEVRYRGLNIAEVLDLSVGEAYVIFSKHPKIARRLGVLKEVGLGYLRLGQSATTLSGGEAQRLKLALELARRETGSTLYLLDEPTSGLHWADVERLLAILVRLREAGNTIIVIEHNLDFIRKADWIVELGPGGGDAGGKKLFQGSRKEWMESSGLETPTLQVIRGRSG